MRTFGDALRAALRGAVARPGFSAVLLLTLAVGIGANTAIYTVADATLRRGLPYPEPDRLVALFETRGEGDFSQMEASYPNFADWRASARSFSALAGFGPRQALLTGAAGLEQVQTAKVLGDFFVALGTRAILGRTLTAADDAENAPPVVVLSHAAWRTRFGADPLVVGARLTLDGKPTTIVGVLEPSFAFAPAQNADFWLPARPTDALFVRRNLHWVNVIGRLAPGASADQARAEMGALVHGLAAAYPDANKGAGVRIVPLADIVLGRARPIVLLLLGAVGLVLLIACANAANLLLARQTSRQKELAVRAALGASRGQLVLLLTVEATVYTLVAGALGVFLALWCVDLLVGSVPPSVLASMPYLAVARVDASALAVTFALALITGVAVGVTVALRAARPDLSDVLKEEGRGTGGPRRGRLRDALVVAEVALAFMLLAGAGLVARSLLAVLAVNPGFEIRGLFTATIKLPDAGYPEDPQQMLAQNELLRRIEALPGVRSAGLINILPLGSGYNTIRFVVDGRPLAPGALEPEANIRSVSDGYFATMGVALVDGRYFDRRDGPATEPAIIVNRTLADRHFPGGAVGQHIRFTFAKDQPLRRIVGVVGDEKLGPLDVAPRPALYVSYGQSPSTFMGLVVRGTIDATTARNAVAGLDPTIAFYDVAMMEDRVARAPWMFVRRFPALLVGAFALLALVLTAVGIYGVLSYTVRQRTHELGIRRAIGAPATHIFGLVLGRGAALAAFGLLIGLAGALAAARLLGSLLFGVAPWDPLTLATVGAGLLTVSLVASWLPARAAVRVDPMEALR